MPYTFSPVHPPLLKETNGNIFDVPPSSLQQLVGVESAWSSVPMPGAGGAIVSKKFTATRRLWWSLTQIPVHYGVDQEVAIKYVTGYSKTQKESIEKTIGGEVGGSFFGLTAKVTADLKLTSDFSAEWHQETTVDTHVKYEANHTYCTWRLNDIIEITVETSTVTPANPPVVTPTTVRDQIISVVAIYQDGAKDQDQLIALNFDANHRKTIA